MLGTGGSGLLLQLTGFQATFGGAQSAETLMRMKWLLILLPAGLWGATLFFIARYPLDRTRMKDIRAALEKRRGTV